MCIIIDACCANALGNTSLPQSKLILEWVKAGGKVISGGQLEKELKGTKLQSLLVEWKASGRLITVDANALDEEETALNLDELRSNDKHVVALARLSNARAVVTRDKALMHDLKRSSQIGLARKVYPFSEEATPNLRIHRGVLRNSGCK